MDSRSLTLMTIAVVVGVVLLLALNFTRFFTESGTGPYLSRVEIKGISIVRDNQEYPLSYEQQNTLVNLVNKALLVKKEDIAEAGTPPDFTKIIVNRFDRTRIEITPVKYVGNDLVFSESTWNPNGWLRDVTHGELKTLILQASSSTSPGDKPVPAATSILEKPRILPADVTGVSLFDFENNEQKLNVANQDQLIGFLNKATPIDKQTVLEKGTKTNFDKIVITRKNGKVIEITAVAYIDDELVFSESLWSRNSLLKDNSKGALKTLVSNYF